MKKVHTEKKQKHALRYPVRPKPPEKIGELLPLVRGALRKATSASARLVELLKESGFDPSHPWAIRAGCTLDAATEAQEWHVVFVNTISGSEGKPPPNPGREKKALKEVEGSTDQED